MIFAASRSSFRALWDDESGATAVEYAIMLAAIAAVIIAIVRSMGQKVLGLFSRVLTEWP